MADSGHNLGMGRNPGKGEESEVDCGEVLREGIHIGYRGLAKQRGEGALQEGLGVHEVGE